MSTMPDGFIDIRRASKERRTENRCKSTELLIKHNVDFKSHNGGAHLVIKHKKETIDFWCGTGKFKVRKGINSRGVFNLLRYMEIEQ